MSPVGKTDYVSSDMNRNARTGDILHRSLLEKGQPAVDDFRRSDDLKEKPAPTGKKLNSNHRKQDMQKPEEKKPEKKLEKEKPAATVNLRFIHTNDTHGYVEEHEPQGDNNVIGGLARIAGEIRELKDSAKDSSVVLDGGDFFDGGFYSKYSGGEIVSKPFHDIEFDAIALGNHDLSWGVGKFLSLADEIGSDFLAANVNDLTKEKGLEKLLKPYTVIEREGVRIGILGLTTELTAVGCPEKGALDVKDAKDNIVRLLEEMKSKEKPDLIVLLSHLGYDQDKEIAGQIDGIDIIVGSHSHTQLEKGEKIKDTIIVQTAGEGNYVGVLDVDFDLKKNAVVSHNARVIPMTADVKPDPGVESIVSSYIEKYRELKEKVLCETGEDLHMFDNSVQPTNLTNLFADAQKMDSDIALSSMFSIRRGIKKGPVTFGDVFNMYPFDNELFQVKATGSQVAKFLESALKDGYKGNYIVSSGLYFEYDPSRDEGDRIVTLTVNGKEYSKEDFSRETFKVSMDNYTQGKSYFKGSTKIKSCGNVFDVLVQYFQEHSPLQSLSSEPRFKKI